MEIIRDRLSEFQKFALREIDHFDLLDIGCAGGIDGVWREIGAKLRAHGFDSNSAEVERLKASETLRDGGRDNALKRVVLLSDGHANVGITDASERSVWPAWA